MGCCCQLEIKKTPQVDLDSLSSEPIQFIAQHNNKTNSLRMLTEVANKDNNDDLFSERIELNDISDVVNNQSFITDTLLEYRKAISDSKKNKKYFLKRLDTVKETNRELSLKKSSSNGQLNSMKGSLYKSKGKQLSIDTIELSCEGNKKNYNSKVEEIRKLFNDKNEDITFSSINMRNNRHHYHFNTNPLNDYNNTLLNFNTNTNSNQCISSSNINVNGNENMNNNHDKLIRQFNMLTLDENHCKVIKKRYPRSLTNSGRIINIFNGRG